VQAKLKSVLEKNPGLAKFRGIVKIMEGGERRTSWKLECRRCSSPQILPSSKCGSGKVIFYL